MQVAGLEMHAVTARIAMRRTAPCEAALPSCTHSAAGTAIALSPAGMSSVATRPRRPLPGTGPTLTRAYVPHVKGCNVWGTRARRPHIDHFGPGTQEHFSLESLCIQEMTLVATRPRSPLP